MKNMLGPSLMCADLMNLAPEIKEMDEAGVDFYHVDIMDGDFVPNIALGPDFVSQLRNLTGKPLDIHMMVRNPERFIKMFVAAGANMISVHCEATDHLQRTLATIKDSGLKAGVAINPGTPLDRLNYALDVTDYVCVMTVNPGFASQKFIPAMFQKVADLKDLIDESGRDVQIEVDGNIGAASIPRCLDSGASMFVLGTSAVFTSGSSLAANINKTRELVNAP